MYPEESEGMGLLRLHATYRHDLKVYSSPEGRCLKTSAAFTQGLLDLDGSLSQVLQSMIRNNNTTRDLLDDNFAANKKMDEVKILLH
jgi:inositol hexakisphosphate/diphosphoinositol-pentakisphosphate kinase